MKTLLLAMKLCLIVLVLLFGCQDNNSLVGNMVAEPGQSNWANYRFNNHQVEVAELEAYPLSELFEYCQYADLDDLKKSIVMLDRQQGTLWITTDRNEIDVRNRTLFWVFLDALIEEHLISILDFGLDQ